MSIIEGISHPLINALGWTLLHSMWQLLVIALLWRFSMFLARNAAATVRYNLSLFALISMPVVFAFTLYRQYQVYSGASRIVSLEYPDAQFMTSGAGNAFYIVQKDYPAWLQDFDTYTPALFWVYIGGLILLSIYSTVNYSRLYSLRRRNIKPLPEHWQVKLNSLINIAGLKTLINVYQTPNISVPAVVGFLRPVVLLPLAMLASLSPAQVESILLHELYHIRRKDHYINLFQNFLEIVFFFHPATWWISKTIRQERENCVDEWVVQHTGTPMEYAQALVSLEEKRSTTLQPVVAATQSKIVLLSRIKNIMTMKTRPFNPGKRMAAITVILTSVISLAWFNPGSSINHGHPGPDYLVQAAPTAWNYSPASGTLDEAPPTPQAQPEEKKPARVRTQDGNTISWEELSEEDRIKLEAALEEMRLGLKEMNKELVERFNSEEFRQQMQQANQEAQRAAAEAHEHFNSEEFRAEMQKVQEEVRKAMEEVREEFQSEEFRLEMKETQEEVRRAMEEVREHFQSEEFKEEMRQAQIEIRNAMKEVDEHFRSEEFEQEMQEVREEIRKAMEEVRKSLEDEGHNMHEIDSMMEDMEWEAMGHELTQTMTNVGLTMEMIGPIVEGSLEAVNIEEILNVVFESLENAAFYEDTVPK